MNAVNVCNSACLFERPFRPNLSHFSNSETPPPRAVEEVTQIFSQMVLKLMECHFDLYGRTQIQARNSETRCYVCVFVAFFPKQEAAGQERFVKSSISALPANITQAMLADPHRRPAEPDVGAEVRGLAPELPTRRRGLKMKHPCYWRECFQLEERLVRSNAPSGHMRARVGLLSSK